MVFIIIEELYFKDKFIFLIIVSIVNLVFGIYSIMKVINVKRFHFRKENCFRTYFKVGYASI